MTSPKTISSAVTQANPVVVDSAASGALITPQRRNLIFIT